MIEIIDNKIKKNTKYIVFNEGKKYISIDDLKVYEQCYEKKKDNVQLVNVNNTKKENSVKSKEQKIKSGAVFVTKNGNPLDRSNIWGDMKKLCKAANVSEKKVFPHNLRHLFARTYYSLQKDIVRLADNPWSQ